MIASKSSEIGDIMGALRVHQWIKNLLVFVPIVCAHQFWRFDQLGRSAVAFFALCAAASGQYVLNDILDRHADRMHPYKKFRPVAAGTIAVPVACTLAFGSIAVSLVTLRIAPALLPVLLSYHGLALAYTLCLKRAVIADIVTLAALYTLRVLAGGAATGIAISPWLLALCLFLFFSLAMMKRYSELIMFQKTGLLRLDGRRYEVTDLPVLLALGIASACTAVLVFALYLQSAVATQIYAHPQRLWLLCPLLMFWISKYWLSAQRGVLDRDPLYHSLHDPSSYLVGLTGLGVFVSSI